MRENRVLLYLLFWLFFNVSSISIRAQIPVEISAGHSGYYYQHAFTGQFHTEKPLGFFHTSSVLIPYDKKRGNEIMSQSYFIYTLRKYWTSGVGSIFTPLSRINRPVNLYARFQYMTTWNWKGHSRSYQYTRLGVDTADLQFGWSVQFDQYGPIAAHYNNVGLFLRRLF